MSPRFPVGRQGLLAAVLLLVQALIVARAADDEFLLVIRDHRFSPTELAVPAGRKLRLAIDNQDPTPEEFESYDLNREKIVPGHGRIVVYIGPLKPGTYEFFGEFNMATARGRLIAK